MPFTDPFVANPYPYAFAVTLPTTGGPYEIVESFVSGVYTISWSGGGTLNADFYNGSTYIGTATGTSSITYNLAQSATKCVLWNTVAGVSVVISLTALAAAPVSGVLHTYTASGTPGLVGDAYVVVVGGGAGGQGVGNYSVTYGGASGGITGGRVTLVGTEVLTIGAGGPGGIGVGGAGPVNPLTPGGTTSFAGFVATGGNLTTAGTPNGGNGGIAVGTPPTASSAASSIFSFFNQGTTGGGGCYVGSSVPGAGAGIGTGGASPASSPNPGNPGTGYGSGGSGAASTSVTNTPENGGAGAPGVCYVVLVA